MKQTLCRTSGKWPRLVMLLNALCVVCGPVGAAEPSESAIVVHLNPSHLCRSAVVRLADVAVIQTADPREAEQLGRVELFPAPAPGGSRSVGLRELQDLVQLHGVNLVRCRFSGAKAVRIEAAPAAPARAAKTVKAVTVDPGRAEQLVREAVARYLAQYSGTRTDWPVRFQLTDVQVRALCQAASVAVTGGGKPPWSGLHNLQLTLRGSNANRTLIVPVLVGQPPMIATAAGPLNRGVVLRPSDVRLQPAPPDVQLADYASRLEEVIGRETVRSLASGQPIALRAVRSPLLVRQGEVVTVFARAAGVRVRATARAMSDGSHGQLILVQTLGGRDQYSARVVDVQEVEVYPRAASATGSAIDSGANAATSGAINCATPSAIKGEPGV